MERLETWRDIEYSIYFGIKKFLPNIRVFSEFRPVWLYEDKWNSNELDIYLPDYKIAIEYNGNIHNNKNCDRTDTKRRSCKLLGIKLLVIGTSDNCDIKLKRVDESLTKYKAKLVRECLKFIIMSLDCSLSEKQDYFLRLKLSKDVLLDGEEYFKSIKELEDTRVFSYDDYLTLKLKMSFEPEYHFDRYDIYTIGQKCVFVTPKDIDKLNLYFRNIRDFDKEIFQRFIDIDKNNLLYNGFTICED